MKRSLILLLCCISTASLLAQSAGLKEVRRLNPTTAEAVFDDGKMLTIDFYGDNIFRIFQDNNGGILRAPQATPPAQILAPHPRVGTSGLTLVREGGSYLLRTPRVEIRLSKDGAMSVKDLRSEETVVESAAPVAFTDKNTTLTFSCRPNEYFYGGGVQNGRFSHRGKSIAIENSNVWVDGGVASPCPFFWSTKGYGLLWHTFKPGRYDFGEAEADKVILSHEENYLDVFIMVDQEPVALLGDFYQLTGNPVLLPKFGFYEGHLNAYNRDYWTESEHGFMAYEDGKRYNESQKDNGGIRESLNGELGEYQFSARAAIDRYLNNDMPLGWFLPNDGYGAGYGQTGTLDGNIRNLKSFGDYARSKGVEIGLWTQSDLYPKDGIEALLQRDIVKEVRDAGVRVLKTDVAWVGPGYSFGLNGVSDVGQVMPYYGNNARPFIISLDGWAGTQRYAGIWTGDQTGGDWEYIRYHIPTFIGSGLSGQPNITNDMDGIFGGKNLPVNVREFQWKTFTPMELNMDGWGSNPKYPQALGEPAASINRSYLKLKSMLMPYTYTIAHEATIGKPMVRALFLDYPNAFTLGTQTQYEFLFGPDFLVAPIYKETAADKEGNDIRNGIYLPEGTWYDYFNGDAYEGGRILNNFDAPIWKLPVFVRSGAIIPMTTAHNTPSQIRKDYRAYEIYPDAESCFVEYDDDGTTEAYKQGESAFTEVRAALGKDKFRVHIAKTVGTYEGFEARKATELRLNFLCKPKKVVAKVGSKKLSLQAAATAEEYSRAAASGQGVYFHNPAPELNRFATPGSDFAKVEIKKNPQLWIYLPATNVQENEVVVEVCGTKAEAAAPLLRSHGRLTPPSATLTDENTSAFALTPSWNETENADYYEIEYDGQLYSTIRQTSLTFDGLQPETAYAFKVRAVNADGYSEWTAVRGRTKADPYQFALKGIVGQTSCPNQSGQGIQKFFDYDRKTTWHTDWNIRAVPFDLTIDLRSVNQLDRFQYQPREDAGNGTILQGTVSLSEDRQSWTEPQAFRWARNGEAKEFAFAANPRARYIRFHVTEAVGDFGSGEELYVFKVPGTESVLQGDINRDGRLDENDLTSYMNYTGLRSGDADFEYVSAGDVNRNGLIDAYDISVVTTQLDGGAEQRSTDKAAGTLSLTADKASFAAGDEVTLTVTGSGLKCVNALSFALPYDPAELEYAGLDLVGMKEMRNLTYDRLHSNGQKELFPCFANLGNNFLLEDGTLFRIKFRAKRAGKFSLQAQDGMLIDRSLGTAKVF
ncbi:MAG: discoidin domain-containing protein [Bacteroidales bacterium]|nr:discoidin domain-containing protein [Bacteroidales bacterium]